MKKIIGMFLVLSMCGSALMAKENSSAFDSLNAVAGEQGDVSIPTAVMVESEQKLEITKGTQGSTAYNTIKQLFELGTPATEKDLTGWYSGFCAFRKNPKILVAAIVIGQPSATAFRMTSFSQPPHESTGYFDDITGTNVASLKYYLKIGYNAYILTFPAAEIMTEDEQTGNKTTVLYRKAGEHIVSHYLTYDTTGKTLTEVYAYYSKNVTPKN